VTVPGNRPSETVDGLPSVVSAGPERRLQQVGKLADVEWAFVETNGEISFIEKSK
jgi:hypothetical protein